MAVLAPPPGARRRDTSVRDASARPQTRPSSAPRRLPGADALRALAAVAVIVIHASYWPLQDRGADDAVWGSVTLLARFAVPAFVVLTGLVLGFRYGDQRLGGAFLLRRARRSVLPWLIWAPVFCLADILWAGGLTPSWSAVANWFAGGAGHLYFLLLVPQLYVLLLLWPARRRPLLALTAAAVMVQVALCVVRLYVPMPGGVLHQLILDHGFELFPFWIGFFAIGVLCGRWLRDHHERSVPAWPFALLVPLTGALLLWDDVTRSANGAYALGTGAFLRPTLLPFALAICGLALFGAPRVLPRAVQTLSRHSLGVYIIHPLLLAGLGRLLAGAMHAHVPWSIPPFLAVTVLCGGGALLISMALARTPLAMTIGEERTRPQPERELLGRRAA
jgi:probable poly-beta-1,6-N-acetyl-D-glucosamine export protein